MSKDTTLETVKIMQELTREVGKLSERVRVLTCAIGLIGNSLSKEEQDRVMHLMTLLPKPRPENDPEHEHQKTMLHLRELISAAR